MIFNGNILGAAEMLRDSKLWADVQRGLKAQGDDLPSRLHNNPPSAIDDARMAYDSLNGYLSATPVVADEATAREAKLFLDRTKASLADLDAAREAEVKPLHDAWKAGIAKYKPAADALDRLLTDLKYRLAEYARAEERKRMAEAEVARQKAVELERIAREAEQAEIEARDNASHGEIGVDIGAATAHADQTFAGLQRAQREAARAERDSAVRIGGGYGRVTTLRTKKTLVLDDPAKALKSVGINDKISDAILSAARAYQKLKGKLPAGVSEIEERTI